jgi:hypothetical protein
MTKKLTQARLRALLKYDPETGVFRWLVASRNARAGDVAGSRYKNARQRTSIRIWVDGREYKAHQLAWLYMTGVRPKRVDHADRDGTNNTWENLQSCTSSQDQVTGAAA